MWLGGPCHGARLTGRQRKTIIDHCIEYDGQSCQGCHERADLDGRPADYKYKIFTVDHVDGDASNHYFDNLQIMHPQCNNAERFKRPQHSELSIIEREKPTAQLHTPAEDRVILEDPRTPVEVLLNYDHETRFRYYVLKAVHDYWRDPRKGRVPRRSDLRQDAREVSGSGLAASYGYMERLFAPNMGPLVEEIDEYSGKGDRFVKFRNSVDSQLTLDELLRKDPKTGRRVVLDYPTGSKVDLAVVSGGPG